MKRAIRSIILGLVALALLVTPVYADPINPIDEDATIMFADLDGRPGAGGPFWIQQRNAAGEWVNIQMSICVERTEYISFGVEYEIESIGQVANGGGRSGQDDPYGDTLDERSAWIFYHFVNWDLFGDPLGQNAIHNYGVVQGAIWCIEGELDTDSRTCTSEPVQDLIAAAATGIGSWSNGGRVAILNPVSTNPGVPRQSQLVLVPDAVATPEPSTLLLLGTGLLGFAIGSRVLRRKK